MVHAMESQATGVWGSLLPFPCSQYTQGSLLCTGGECRDADTALQMWARKSYSQMREGTGGTSESSTHSGAAGMMVWSRAAGHFQESARGLQPKRWKQKQHVTVEEGRVGKVDWYQIAKGLKFQTEKCVFNSSENRKKLKGNFLFVCFI